MKTTIKYKSTGLVYGKYWGGGEGSYPAEKLEADTKEDLLKKANEDLKSGALDSGMGYEDLKSGALDSGMGYEDLKSGALDSGMGYESLLGALLAITKITTVVINGKSYTNEEEEFEFIGSLSLNQADFLENQLY